VSSRRAVALALAVTALVAGTALQAPDGHPPVEGDADPRWNVVVVVSDDQNAESLPHRPAVMPLLQAAAADPGEHWVRFRNAFANTPMCCPARATLLTGRYAHEHGVLDNGLGLELDPATTVAAWLDRAGYETGLVGKYLNQYPFGRAPFVPLGWDRWWAKEQGGGGSVYLDYTLIEDGVPTAYGHRGTDYLTDVLADTAVGFLREVPARSPFLLWFAPTAPHPPWVPAPRHAGRFADLPVEASPAVGERDVRDKPRWVRALPRIGPAVRAGLREAERRSYETLLALDDAVRTIVRELEALGELDRTVVVYVSDNGFSFGEHGWVGKACPYDACIRVPLLIRYPPVEGRVEDAPVSHLDLAPTIAALAGVEPTAPVSGRSLLPLLADGDATGLDPTVFAEWAGDARIPGWRQVRTPRFAYIELDTGERELYDVRADPFQLRNVVDDPDRAAVVDRLASALWAFRSP
jgi:arylsulfatase A-like enzyme